jgi:hypothetical protein
VWFVFGMTEKSCMLLAAAARDSQWCGGVQRLQGRHLGGGSHIVCVLWDVASVGGQPCIVLLDIVASGQPCVVFWCRRMVGSQSDILERAFLNGYEPTLGSAGLNFGY